MNPQRMQLDEKIDYILQGENLQTRAARAQDIAVGDASFVQYMHMAAVTTQKISGLPEGMPDTYKPETTIPSGISDTTARQELRRIKNFLPGGTLTTLSRSHRESVWANLMMGLHWKEAEVVGLIKDQTLFTKYPELRNVLIELKVPVDVQQQATEKKKAPKSK
jgi:hypothetical protein